MPNKKEKPDSVLPEERLEESSEEEYFESSEEEEYEVITLQYTIPGTNNFVRLNLLDAEEERVAFEDMYETCGEDFTDYEVL